MNIFTFKNPRKTKKIFRKKVTFDDFYHTPIIEGLGRRSIYDFDMRFKKSLAKDDSWQIPENGWFPF